MRISARADYALRATAELACGGASPIKAERIAGAQHIPLKFLLNILGELKHARVVQSRSGPEGGYRLARPPGEITLAEAIRAGEGPLANIKDGRPQEPKPPGPA